VAHHSVSDYNYMFFLVHNATCNNVFILYYSNFHTMFEKPVARYDFVWQKGV